MNKVANIEGKGRDDFSLNTLIVAEGVIRKVSVNNSKSIRNLAEGVKTTFMKFRKMLEKYSENIETVDPQLKNNPELVENLLNFETAWDKGREFLIDEANYSRLIFFSQLIEIICEKYNEVTELIETRDPSIFVSVPGLLILKSLDGEDQGTCFSYNPNLIKEGKECNKIYNELKLDYEKLKSKLECKTIPTNQEMRSKPCSRVNSSNKINQIKSSLSLPNVQEKPKLDMLFLYNFLERVILFEENLVNILCDMNVSKDFYDSELVNRFIGKIKILSMNLQREKPSEWNSFFDMAMTTISGN